MTLIKRKSNKYNYPALTLIEMLVSMSVVGIIATIFILNYQNSTKRTGLVMASQGLVTDIHYAQNNALGLAPYGDAIPGGGWGVYFDLDEPGHYVIFPDLEQPDEPGYHDYDPQTEGDVNLGARKVQLPQGVIVSDIYFANNTQKNTVSITFLPPDPQVNIYSGNVDTTEVRIELKDLRTDSIKTVLVNFLGLVEAID